MGHKTDFLPERGHANSPEELKAQGKRNRVANCPKFLTASLRAGGSVKKTPEQKKGQKKSESKKKGKKCESFWKDRKRCSGKGTRRRIDPKKKRCCDEFERTKAKSTRPDKKRAGGGSRVVKNQKNGMALRELVTRKKTHQTRSASKRKGGTSTQKNCRGGRKKTIKKKEKTTGTPNSEETEHQKNTLIEGNQTPTSEGEELG